MAAPIGTYGTILTASHCGASRRGPGTRPRAVVCWLTEVYDGGRTDASICGSSGRRSADHSSTEVAAAWQRPRTGRASSDGKSPGDTQSKHQRRSPPRTGGVVEAGPDPAMSTAIVQLAASRTWRGGSWRRSAISLAETDGRARVEERSRFAKISARPSPLRAKPAGRRGF